MNRNNNQEVIIVSDDGDDDEYDGPIVVDDSEVDENESNNSADINNDKTQSYGRGHTTYNKNNGFFEITINDARQEKKLDSLIQIPLKYTRVSILLGGHQSDPCDGKCKKVCKHNLLLNGLDHVTHLKVNGQNFEIKSARECIEFEIIGRWDHSFNNADVDASSDKLDVSLDGSDEPDGPDGPDGSNRHVVGHADYYVFPKNLLKCQIFRLTCVYTNCDLPNLPNCIGFYANKNKYIQVAQADKCCEF